MCQMRWTNRLLEGTERVPEVGRRVESRLCRGSYRYRWSGGVDVPTVVFGRRRDLLCRGQPDHYFDTNLRPRSGSRLPTSGRPGSTSQSTGRVGRGRGGLRVGYDGSLIDPSL